MLLDGTVAIVTGGNRGIGAATSRILAREGAAVVIAARNLDGSRAVADEIEGSGGRAIAVPCDVALEADVAAMVESAIAAFGGIDILVNNAGMDAGATLLETSAAHWDRVMGVNLKGHFLCSVAVVPWMTQRGGGAIVNTSSVLALSTLPGCGAYTASKAAIMGLTRSMALEWAPFGIRVNCIVPGSTDTDMMWLGLRADEIPEERRRLEAEIPLGRVADPEEIAEATLWLCSKRASFATGSFLSLDGGTLSRSPSSR